MKKLLLTFGLVFGLLFMLSLVSAASPTLGTFKVNQEIELKQTCTINGTFCDFCNISSVDYPNGSRALSDVIMTKRGGDFNYSFDSTYVIDLGQYKNNGYCTYGSDVIKNWVYYFEVTSTGKSEVSVLDNQLLIIFVVIGVLLMIMGIYTTIPWFGFIGSVMFLLSGIYTMIYGLGNVTDFYTRGVAIVLLGLGFIFMFISAYEWIWGGKED